MNRILLLESQSGDWQILYIDNELITQGHHIGEGVSTKFWFELGQKYSNAQFVTKTLHDYDEQFLEEYGTLTTTASNLFGQY